jgi:hypothetical protein
VREQGIYRELRLGVWRRKKPKPIGIRRGRTCALSAILAVGMMAAVLPATASAEACRNTAFRIGFVGLPDCRAYEQVSPLDKNGLDATPDIEQEAGFVSGSLPVEVSQTEKSSGETSVAYQSPAALAGTEGNQLSNAYIATRRGSEWQMQAISAPTPQPGVPGVFFLSYDFATDLSHVVIKVPLQRLVEGASEGVVNLYLRRLPDPERGYSLISAPPLISPPANCGICIIRHKRAFSGASSSFQNILFEASEALIPGAPEGVESLYENVGGQVRLVGILPDGTIAPGPSAAGAGLEVEYASAYGALWSKNVNHAISQDGSRAFFKASADGGVPDPAQAGLVELYERVEGNKTIEISAPAKGAAPMNSTAEPAQFWAASTDGEHVFFTSSAELTTQSNTGSANAGQDLYLYNTNTEELADLSVDNNPIDKSGAGVLGVVGASSDGSYVYFVADGQLVDGKGVDGQPNLYLSHENKLTHARETGFIATLNSADTRVWIDVPAFSESYITPEGSRLAFMSIGRLTGYNNEDLNVKGRLDSEVYEYSARVNQADGQLEGGGLVCASCDPDGRQPVGGAFIGVHGREESSNTPFYRPRILNDNGDRLFFSSPDSLVPGLTSSRPAIFEYENGSVELIAAPSTSTNDLFLDASPSGNDVFFATRDQLVPSDQDNLVDIYDARVEGGLPTQMSPTVQCVGSGCQGPLSAPPALPVSASTLFSGSGNLGASSTAPHEKKHKPRRSSAKKRHPKVKVKGNKGYKRVHKRGYRSARHSS